MRSAIFAGCCIIASAIRPDKQPRRVNGRILWGWRLSLAERRRVDSETRSEVLDKTLLDAVLEAKNLMVNAKRKG